MALWTSESGEKLINKLHPYLSRRVQHSDGKKVAAYSPEITVVAKSVAENLGSSGAGCGVDDEDIRFLADGELSWQSWMDGEWADRALGLLDPDWMRWGW